MVDSAPSENQGVFNSLKYDQAGTPHLAYASYLPNQLKYATQVGNGNGNCGPSTSWQCDVIDDSGDWVGRNASLGLTLGGSPRIAYTGYSRQLGFARRLSTNSGNCGPAGTWQCDIIDGGPNGFGIGVYPSLYVAQCSICGTGGNLRIAYYNGNSQSLMFAETVPANTGNCGYGSQLYDWQCDVIETIGYNLERGISLAVVNGVPVIAYQDSDDSDHNILKIARRSNGPGNCGPADAWLCEVLDDGARAGSDHDIGDYVSLASAPDGRLYIAYYDETAGDLLLMFQGIPLFLPFVRR
jgi:hypothetical protein